MSQSIQLADTLNVDSRLLIGSHKKVQILKGASNATTQRTTASSFSNSQLVFNCVLNNAANTIVDSYQYVEVPITVTINATGLATPVPTYLANNFAFRQFPLASVTSVCQVQINNQSTTSNPSQFIHQLSQFQNFYDQASAQSITPIMGDQASGYAQLVGSGKSPLLGYAAGGEHYSSPRGEFNSIFSTTVGTTGQWVFNATVREPIFNPLLDYSPTATREGLAYVSLFNVTLNFLSNLSRMFSLDAITCPAITSINVDILGATLVQEWLTSPISQALPPVVLRSYNSLVCNQTAQSAFSAGESRVIQSQSYSMNQIPRKIWVYVADSQTDIATGYNKSDFTFSIDNITVLFNNRSGLLSTYNFADLYNACYASELGINTFVQSRIFCGAVLCLDPAKLFSLSDTEAPGMLGTYQLQIQATCRNFAGGAIIPNMWVIFGMDTILSTDQYSVSNIQQGFIHGEDVIAATKLPASPTKFLVNDIYGSGFLDTLKNLACKAAKFVKDNKLISTGLSFVPHPAAQLASQAAKQLGVGRTSRRLMQQRALRY